MKYAKRIFLNSFKSFQEFDAQFFKILFFYFILESNNKWNFKRNDFTGNSWKRNDNCSTNDNGDNC